MSEKRFIAHHRFAKTWPDVFSKDRRFKEDTPWVEEKRKHGACGSDITLVIQESEDDEHSTHVQELEAFCRGAQLADVRDGNGEAGHQQTAWVKDITLDQQIRKTRCRKYPNPMTATGLFQALSKKVSCGR